jgi:hypothetical protein
MLHLLCFQDYQRHRLYCRWGLLVFLSNKWKKRHTVRTFPKFNRKTIERGKHIRYNKFKNKVGIQPKFKVCISRKCYIKMHCSYNESDYYTMFKNQ